MPIIDSLLIQHAFKAYYDYVSLNLHEFLKYFARRNRKHTVIAAVKEMLASSF